MATKISNKFLSVNGKRVGIYIDAGPWVEGVNPELIKVRCKKGCFPSDLRAAFKIENNSDMREDYFENDSIRLLPGDFLYAEAKALS